MRFNHKFIFTAFLLALSSIARAAPCSLALYEKLGERPFPVTTKVAEAQKYVDQAMMLANGFNHEEAARFFEHAAKLDPGCAMCNWGLGYVLGPNINRPMPAAASIRAYAATQKALALAAGVSEREQAYIQALATRYVADPVPDRVALDRAYANAMKTVVDRFPDDLDARALHAEALMDTSPWGYWNDGGVANETTRGILAGLETILKKDPDHVGAQHLLIHVVEEHHPEVAESFADRLLSAAPDAGHLVHMPSHIYIRVGRYNDAVRSNALGIAADARFLERCPASEFYAMMYVPHNYGFFAAANAIEGRSADAIAAARKMAEMAAPHLEHAGGMLEPQNAVASIWLLQVRFGKWQDILAANAPADDLLFAKGLYHYARAVAFGKTGNQSAADGELAALKAAAEDPRLASGLIMGVNKATHILNIAIEEASGILQSIRGNSSGAIGHLNAAIVLQDSLRYMEPAPWPRSVRLVLGETQLAARQPMAAEAAFRADLKRLPENGWSLNGLARSLALQGRVLEADAAKKRFERAWLRADYKLPESP